MAVTLLSDAVLFQISINPVNRTTSEYPVYIQSSTLNSNENFDFGTFRILRYYVTKTDLDIKQFLFAFEEEGDYVFANSQESVFKSSLNMIHFNRKTG